MKPVWYWSLALVAALAAACGDGGKVEGQLAKGKAHIAEGKYESAIAELKKATEADKNSLDAWLQLGHAYRATKQYDDALSAYVAAKKIDRHAVAPHLSHAKVQVDLGRVELATTELNMVVEMDPKNLEALILLGKVSQMPYKQPDGSVGQSKVSLERAELNLHAASILDPKNADVQFELVKVASKLGKGEEARTALKNLQSLAATDATAQKLVPDAEAALKAAGL
jgi:tetratricopeptide (TPR) repeat protein